MEILQILQDTFGSFQKSTQKQGHSNYSFECPFCMHKKKKLEIDILTGFWHCWVCNAKGRTLYSLFKRRKISKAILDRVRQLSRDTTRNTKPQTPSDERLSLPKDFIPLYEGSKGLLRGLALNYLERRNFTGNDIEKFGIGYCETGHYRDCIIIPSYDADWRLNYFIGRSFRQWDEIKYRGPSVDKNFIGFESLISWEFPVVLVEGPFDAIAARRNAIPLFGKTIRSKLKEKIVDEYPPELFIAVDPDAKTELYQIYEYFSNFGINTKIVELGDRDPADLGFAEFWNRVTTQSKKISSHDTFEQKLKNLIK